MSKHWILALVVCIILLLPSLSIAQSEAELIQDQLNALENPGSPETFRLACELSRARKAGDIPRVRELEKALFEELPTLPLDPSNPPPMIGGGSFEETSTPLWGNDVKIYTGDLFSYGKRQVCIDSDTLGRIYVAFNATYHDTTSSVRVYRSTNGGLNWSSVNMFYWSSGYPIQSMDMCVTDSAGGRWVLAFAFVIKTDKTSGGGGHLWFARMRDDGSGFSAVAIANASTGTAYRNPSICTDGGLYSPLATYHFVAAEYLTPATDESRGIFVRRTTNWGVAWGVADTALRGYKEGTPVIAVDWSTVPDSMVIAYTRTISGKRQVRIGRNTKALGAPWTVSGISTSTDDYDPAMAMDPVRGNAIVTFTRGSGAPTYEDALYLASTDLFKTFKKDSIATSTGNDGLTSVSYAPWGTGYYWRVGYRTSAGGLAVHYKAISNSMHSFHTQTPTVVSQFSPSGVITPVVGYDRDIGGTNYRGNVAYVGYGPTNVYFDAVDLTLDVPVDAPLPASFALEQNYPNPFNPTTTIKYSIPVAGAVRLSIFDLLGREVRLLEEGVREAGTYATRVDARGLASGVYLYRLQAGDFTQTRSMVLLK